MMDNRPSVLAPLSAAQLAIVRRVLAGACGDLKDLVAGPELLAEISALHAETDALLPEQDRMMLHWETDRAAGDLYGLMHREPQPGRKVWTHWHNQVGRHRVTHDTAAIVVRSGPDGITVREVGYGAMPHDVFDVDPA